MQEKKNLKKINNLSRLHQLYESLFSSLELDPRWKAGARVAGIIAFTFSAFIIGSTSYLDPHNALNIHDPLLHDLLVGVIFFLSIKCIINVYKTHIAPEFCKKEKKTEDKSLQTEKEAKDKFLQIAAAFIPSVALSVQLYMLGVKTAVYISWVCHELFQRVPLKNNPFQKFPVIKPVCLKVLNVFGNMLLVSVSFFIILFATKQLVKLVKAAPVSYKKVKEILKGKGTLFNKYDVKAQAPHKKPENIDDCEEKTKTIMTPLETEFVPNMK